MRDYSRINEIATAGYQEPQPAPEPQPQPQPEPQPQPAPAPADKDTTQGGQPANAEPGANPAGEPAVDNNQPATASNPEPAPAAPPAGNTAPIPATISADILKELGVTSLDELKEKLKAPETAEQKSAREKTYTASLDNYAITNNLMERDEILRLENLKSADNEKVVYDDFAAKYKAANAEATDDSVKLAFESLYHIGSQNPELQTYGKGLLDTAAATIRSAVQSKYDNAKQMYDLEQERSAKVPGFLSLIDNSIKLNVPDTLDVYAKGDVKVGVQLTEADRTELKEMLRRPDVFNEFLKPGNQQNVEKDLKNKIEAFVWMKHRNTILDATLERGRTEGTKAGSNAGAHNPFPLTQAAQQQNAGANAGATNPQNAGESDLTQKDLDHMRSRKGRWR